MGNTHRVTNCTYPILLKNNLTSRIQPNMSDITMEKIENMVLQVVLDPIQKSLLNVHKQVLILTKKVQKLEQRQTVMEIKINQIVNQIRKIRFDLNKVIKKYEAMQQETRTQTNFLLSQFEQEENAILSQFDQHE